MALEVIYGESRNRAVAIQLASELANVVSEGTVYLGYPVLASADERVYVDALLVSREHGLVAFQIATDVPESETEWDAYVANQDRLYGMLASHLGRHDNLRLGRGLRMPIETITVFAAPVTPLVDVPAGHYCDLQATGGLVAEFPPIEEDTLRALNSALQRVTIIKPPKKRAAVSLPNSRGTVLKEIEKNIANLDRWQKAAAIETPDGPQRIRGLAGSGKTVVLALKAAYLYSQHPDWMIAVTFASRSLYAQLEDLVTRFTVEHSNDLPDFDHLRIIHAWGSSARDGLYSTIARALGAPPRDFNYAVATFGREDAFKGACAELLAIASGQTCEPLFDAVLIDEAQDLPPEFFQLVYKFTAEPKRIIWAFDELQRLSETAMPATDELFGVTDSGAPLVSLVNTDGEARRDIVLPVCYRNSPWSLATAHSLGFGIYRNGGLLQGFDDPEMWHQIGYSVIHGRLEEGEEVELERSTTSYPSYFVELLDPADAVVLRSFSNEVQQDSWVAEQIVHNLSRDELEHDDILVVLPDAYTSKRRASRFALHLTRHGIDSHLVGVGSSADQVFLRNSIAMAHIYRAKGNEASMVYVLDSQYAARTPNIITRRNTLFTAITRSRAWVRVCGFGPEVNEIVSEIEAVQTAGYRLNFRVPTAGELAKLRRVHRERSDAEVASLKRATRSAEDLIEAVEENQIALEDLPEPIRARLLNLVREAPSDAADA